jgi:hypothetical protein
MANENDSKAYMMSASSTDPVRVPSIPTVQFKGKTLQEHSSYHQITVIAHGNQTKQINVYTWLTPLNMKFDFSNKYAYSYFQT